MSLRGTGAGRDHLRPKAPPEGPLAVWHNRTARPGIKNRQRIPRPRAVSVSAVEPVRRTSPAGSAGDSGAHSALVAISLFWICLSILARIRKDKGFGDIVSRETVLILHSVLHPPCGKTAVRPPHVPFRPHAVILNEVKNLPTSRPTHPPCAEILRRRLLRMTKKSGDERASCLNEESFQEKQNEIPIVSRETKSPSGKINMTNSDGF